MSLAKQLPFATGRAQRIEVVDRPTGFPSELIGGRRESKTQECARWGKPHFVSNPAEPSQNFWLQSRLLPNKIETIQLHFLKAGLKAQLCEYDAKDVHALNRNPNTKNTNKNTTRSRNLAAILQKSSLYLCMSLKLPCTRCRAAGHDAHLHLQQKDNQPALQPNGSKGYRFQGRST